MAATATPVLDNLDEVSGRNSTLGRLDPYDPGNKEAGDRATSLLEKYLRRGKFQRFQFEREWFRRVLYYAGNQWVQWHKDEKRWVSKKGPKWYPRPVTNVYADKVDDNIASLTQQPPQMQWSPETGEDEDLATARVSQRIDDLIAEETGRQRKARERAAWCVLTGDVFVESYYDASDEHGMAFLQYEECYDCGYAGPPLDFRAEGGKCPGCGSENVFPAKQRTGAVCPQCGHESPNPEDAYTECPECAFAEQFRQPVSLEAPGAPASMAGIAPQASENFSLPPEAATGVPPTELTAIGPIAQPPAPEPSIMEPARSQEPLGEEVPRGRMADRTLSPFEVFFDHLHVKEFTRDGGLKWAIVIDMIDQEEAENVYGFRPELAVSKATSSQSDTSLSTLYLESLAVLTDGYSDTRSGRGAPGIRAFGSDSKAGGVLRERLFLLPETHGKPNAFTEGLYCVRLNGSGGRMVERKPLPYHDHDGTPFIPIVHIPFKHVPGRVWGKTMASDIIPLQDQRNMTEAEMMLNERRMSNAVWIIPENSVVRKPTGEPGEQIYYIPRDVGTGGQNFKPERMPGIAPSDYFLKRMEQLDRDIERIAGSFGVAHGEAPPGITAASALALLGERQQRQVSPQISAWEFGHEQIALHQMHIFREYAADTRVHAAMGKDSEWKIEKWSSADVAGRINVRVKTGSAMPRSSATRRAQIEALTRMQALSVQNPEERRRILEEFGEDDIIGDYSIDVADARKEQDRFMLAYRGEPGGELPSFRPLFDNHAVHLPEHTKLGKTDEYRKLERLARTGDRYAQGFIGVWEEHMNMHVEALNAAAMAAAEQEQGENSSPEGKEGKKKPEGGQGRPKDTGNVLSRGARAPGEEATRTVLEPRTGAGAT